MTNITTEEYKTYDALLNDNLFLNRIIRYKGLKTIEDYIVDTVDKNIPTINSYDIRTIETWKNTLKHWFDDQRQLTPNLSDTECIKEAIADYYLDLAADNIDIVLNKIAYRYADMNDINVDMYLFKNKMYTADYTLKVEEIHKIVDECKL